MENNFNVQSEVSTNENIPEEKLTSGKKIIIVFLAIILTVALVVVALLMCETITGKEVFNFSSKNEDVVEDDDKYEAENEDFEYGFDVDYADDITVDENESDTTTVTDTS